MATQQELEERILSTQTSNTVIPMPSQQSDNYLIFNDTDKISKSIEFAMVPYSIVMTINQVKIHAIALSQIKADEELNINKRYTVDLNQIFPYFTAKDKSTYKRNIVNAAVSLHKQNPQIAIFKEDGVALTSVFQTVYISKDKSTIEVEYTREFRNYMIKMKKEYDFEYSIGAILKLSCKYAPGLYSFLLGKIATIRKEQPELMLQQQFTVEIAQKELMNVIRYDGNTEPSSTRYNSGVLFPAIADINEHTNMHIEEKPEYITDGKKIVGYRFSITVNMTPTNPIFRFDDIKNYSQLSEVLTIEYVSQRIQETLGVNKSFAKYVLSENNVKKAWRSYLYTLLYCKTETKAMYFNTVYKKDLALSRKMKTMFEELLILSAPELQDFVSAWIGKFYIDQEKGLVDEIPEVLQEETPDNDQEAMLKKIEELQAQLTKKEKELEEERKKGQKVVYVNNDSYIE